MSAVTGRFAPSPSGRLHLGNLACSLLAWLSARSQGGRIVLRIEDLDAERCPRKYADALEEDLRWLGLVWDEGGSSGGPNGPYYQSECAAIYTESYNKLEAQGLVYPCFCSRAQLHAASAPHTSDGNVIYPGTCRGLTAEQIAEKRKKKAPAYRLMVPDEDITFTDGCMGPHTENLLRDCGDFYLRRADGVFAYQLAVVVDDALMGVTEVVRGSDLLSSTPRHWPSRPRRPFSQAAERALSSTSMPLNASSPDEPGRRRLPRSPRALTVPRSLPRNSASSRPWLMMSTSARKRPLLIGNTGMALPRGAPFTSRKRMLMA